MSKYLLSGVYVSMLLLFINCSIRAQCPANINFENGNLDGWSCYAGRITWEGIINISLTGRLGGRHEIVSTENGDEKDYYGDFSKKYPGGGKYSFKLGNDEAYSQAEGISYTLTVPANNNDYSLIYYYAIVFNDVGHLPAQQPRFRIKTFNETDNQLIACASYDYIANSSLPGFLTSTKPGRSGGAVIYKDWSPAFINLSGLAGKVITITFTSSDCALGDHFCYGYVDFGSECGVIIPGAVYCAKDSFVTLKAPPGFQTYKWYNSIGTVLGAAQILTLSPPPAGGTTIFVDVTPYLGYGCSQTFKAVLDDGLDVTARAGPDLEYCADKNIQLGEAGVASVIYKWSPEFGLSNPDISNPVINLPTDITYTLLAQSPGGGCKSTDEVKIIKKCRVINLFVPSSFTPNGDGLNDRLRPVLYGFSKVNYFRIYNRYGNLLYSADSDLPGWDGTIKGKPASTQTVVWMIEAVDAYNRVERRQGTSILIR